jgi:outer membrane biosynthesis protein TonB
MDKNFNNITVENSFPWAIVAFLASFVIFYFLYNFLAQKNVSPNKKGLILSTYTIASIVLVMFLLRFWPPANQTEMLIAQSEEGSMGVNFGNTDMGMGDNYLDQNLEVTMQEEAASSSEEESSEEEILTNENTGIAVKTPPKTNKPKKTNPNTNTKPKNNAPKNNSSNAMNTMLKGKNKGDGDSNTPGNQGKTMGGKSKNYKGFNDDDGEGNGNSKKGKGKSKTNLAGRKNLYNPVPENSCNLSGTVVITVHVDKSGKVVKALNSPGTNADACLINLARAAALKTKWEPSENAADIQVGSVTYNFTF